MLLTSGKEKYYLFCVLSGTVVNALLNYVLIPIYTQNGAAIASVIAELTVSVSMIIVSRKTIKVNIYHKDALSIFLITTLIFVLPSFKAVIFPLLSIAATVVSLEI